VTKRDGEIGQMDVAMRVAADGQPVALDPPGADDLAPFGAVGDGAEKEGHRRATSRRRR
jgi:hypothetical protein